MSSINVGPLIQRRMSESPHYALCMHIELIVLDAVVVILLLIAADKIKRICDASEAEATESRDKSKNKTKTSGCFYNTSISLIMLFSLKSTSL